MRALSLFDGYSGAQVALNKLGVPVDQYFASEVDKWAIKVTQNNYSNTIQLGDVREVKGRDLPKIDLVIGGSPCQGFSFAGKQLNFDDPRSKLFFEYVRILKEIKEVNPEVIFLLENVKMKKEYQKVISDLLGVEPIEINSALVSAQNRRRLYWTNIEGVEQPEDKHIYLKDILEDVAIHPLGWEIREKSKTIRVGGRKSPLGSKQEWDSPYVKINKKGKIKTNQSKASCLTGGGNSGGNHSDMDLIAFMPNDNIKQFLLENKDKVVFEEIKCINPRKEDGTQTYQLDRIYDPRGKSPALLSSLNGRLKVLIDNNLLEQYFTYRRLTPLECERLQTLPDGYTEGVSNTQRYKMLGNGFTIDVIAHILSYAKDRWMKKEKLMAQAI